MSRSDIVRATREWIGTPYRHQHGVKGAGCDCLGLIRGVWTELLGAMPEAVPPYTMDWAETGSDEVLWAAARRHLTEKRCDAVASGDVILFRMANGAVAKHLGIQTELAPQPRFVHAYSGHGVVESALSTPWQRRIVARFEFPIRNEEAM